MKLPKLDWMNLSVDERQTDLSVLAKECFNTEVVSDPNPKYNFRRLKGISYVTIVSYHNVTQLQFEGSYFNEPNAFEQIKNIYRWLQGKGHFVRIARIDVAVDFPGKNPEDLISKAELTDVKFPQTPSIKVSSISQHNHLQTVYFATKTFKIRIYDRIASAQHLLSKGRAHQRHINEIREYGEMGLTRCEWELRGRHCRYADRIFLFTKDEQEFCQQALNLFLREVPFIKNSDDMPHPLWESLKTPGLKKIDSPQVVQLMNKERKTQELNITASFLKNKFNKWGFNQKESIQFILEAFGLYHIEIDFDGRETIEDLKFIIRCYESEFGPLPVRASVSKAS